MRHVLMNLSANLVSLTCIAAAAYLLINDKNGWGWFLFVGMVCAGVMTSKSDNNE